MEKKFGCLPVINNVRIMDNHPRSLSQQRQQIAMNFCSFFPWAKGQCVVVANTIPIDINKWIVRAVIIQNELIECFATQI